MESKIEAKEEKNIIKEEMKPKKVNHRSQRVEAKEVNHRYQRDKDREVVKGIFRFHECPGATMQFPYRAYKEDQVERYDLTDGQIYSIPLGVAKHLNKNCWYPEYGFIPTYPGQATTDVRTGVYNPTGNAGQYYGHGMTVIKKIRRCSFQSLEFVDIEDLTPVGGPLILEAAGPSAFTTSY